jgi:hypothetical protein
MAGAKAVQKMAAAGAAAIAWGKKEVSKSRAFVRGTGDFPKRAFSCGTEIP